MRATWAFSLPPSFLISSFRSFAVSLAMMRMSLAACPLGTATFNVRGGGGIERVRKVQGQAGKWENSILTSWNLPQKERAYGPAQLQGLPWHRPSECSQRLVESEPITPEVTWLEEMCGRSLFGENRRGYTLPLVSAVWGEGPVVGHSADSFGSIDEATPLVVIKTNQNNI